MFPFSGRRLMETLERLPNIASLGLMVRDSAPNGRIWLEVGGRPAISYSVPAA